MFSLIQVLSVLFILAPVSHASWDASVSGALRSRPLGGGAKAEVGHGFVLWGDAPQDNSDPNPWYGFFRPSLMGSTAGTYNSLGGELELYPLGFLGLVAGYERAKNDKDYRDFDCLVLKCKGEYTRRYIGLRLGLKIWKAFLLASARQVNIREKTTNQDFVEPLAALAADRAGDQLQYLRLLAGFDINERWKAAYIGAFSKMQTRRGASRMNTLNAIYQWEDLSFLFGLGVFESTLIPMSGTILGSIKWQIEKGVKLF